MALRFTINIGYNKYVGVGLIKAVFGLLQ